LRVSRNQNLLQTGLIKSLYKIIFLTLFVEFYEAYTIKKKPKDQAKLVTVLKGKIFDVAVDIRKDSPTFGKWVGAILSEDNHKLIYIPEGFAHGFCVLSEYANVLYKVNNEYSPEHEKGIIWNDPKINISWPIKNPIISNRDNELPTLENLDNNFVYEK